MKVCSKCKIEKEFSDFGKDKTRKDGYRYVCKECNKPYSRRKANEYYEANKDTYNEKRKLYRKEYLTTNREKVNQQMYNYRKQKRVDDPIYRLRENIRCLINSGFNSKKPKSTEDILGCSFEVFKIHLESQFEDWMTWKNKGNPNDGLLESNKSWDIDHIIPVSSAKTEEELIKLNHYTNLQPLCSYQNRIVKKDKL